MNVVAQLTIDTGDTAYVTSMERMFGAAGGARQLAEAQGGKGKVPAKPPEWSGFSGLGGFYHFFSSPGQQPSRQPSITLPGGNQLPVPRSVLGTDIDGVLNWIA